VLIGVMLRKNFKIFLAFKKFVTVHGNLSDKFYGFASRE
jgi:hypothetical protein